MEGMDSLVIAGRTFSSRLIVGTGKYKDGPQTRDAIAASDRARQWLRPSNDALDGVGIESVRAQVMARLGDRSQAIAQLEREMKMPGGDTPATLRLDADFDRLRGDPRFERLAHSDATTNN